METADEIAKVGALRIGFEGHGIPYVQLSFEGNGWGQSTGAYRADQYSFLADFVYGVLKALGVQDVREVGGQIVKVVRDGDDWNARIVGFRTLGLDGRPPVLWRVPEGSP